MKIGILTYHAVSNFGANLQALSTVGYLRNKGFDPIIINWVPEELENKYINEVSESQREAHRRFCSDFLPMTELCRKSEDVENAIINHKIKGLFIGSDALWNYIPQEKRRLFSFRRLKYIYLSITPDHDYPNPFWGRFSNKVNTIPKVAFSVSSQNMPYALVKGELKNSMSYDLLNFKFISVRDLWTKHLVESFTDNHISPEISPDPVFGFNSNVGEKISKNEILEKFNLPEKYVLLSFKTPRVTEEWVSRFEELCHKQGFTCVAFPMPEKLNTFQLKYKIELPLSPIDWYYLIKYSAGYVGERMHPVIVSLHNAVPAYCFDEYGLARRFFPSKKQIYQSSKVYDILNRAKLQDNYYSYKAKERLPSPDEVFHKIMHFDKNKCIAFSNQQDKRYNEYMEQVITIFNESL